MTPDVLPLVGQVVAALLGVGFTGAVLTYLTARRRLPIERDSAAAAASGEISKAAASLVQPLREQIDQLRTEVKVAQAKATEAHEAAARAEASAERSAAEVILLRKIATDADDYVTDLHERWPHHRQQDRPPLWRWHSDLEPTPTYHPDANTD